MNLRSYYFEPDRPAPALPIPAISESEGDTHPPDLLNVPLVLAADDVVEALDCEVASCFWTEFAFPDD